MKNRINLYSKEMQPELQVISLTVSITIWLLCSLISLSAFWYVTSNQQMLSNELAQRDGINVQQRNILSQLQGELDNRQRDPALLAKIDEQQAMLQIKKLVLNEIVGQEQLKSAGFSQVMLQLASNHQNGLWLNHIRLTPDKVLIEGGASESSIIPQWVNKLSQMNYFKGQNFAATRLYRGDDQVLYFLLASDLSDSGKASSNNGK